MSGLKNCHVIRVERNADRKHFLQKVVINFAFVRTLWLRKKFLYPLPISIEMHFQLEIRIHVSVVFS